jgi:hypothetical protein
MTPRQLRVWLGLARKRRRTELAELLHITALGSRGEPKDVKEQIEMLQAS